MDAVLTCMVEEKIGPGEMNQKLIKLVCETFQVSGAAAFRSPAIALSYALNALDLEEGAQVIISALAPSWQYVELIRKKYRPLVIDVRQENALVTAEAIEEAVKNGGRTVILHETLGFLPGIEEILSLGIPVIEDISQSAGATIPAPEGTERTPAEAARARAGLYGVFAILSLEERDVVTAGGGAVVMAGSRRDWIPLKKYTDEAPLTDLLPDLNAALAWVELREFNKNEEKRKEIFTLFQRACMSGRHTMLVRDFDGASTMCTFPLVLSSAYKDVKQYTDRKGIEIARAFERSVIALRDEALSPSCIRAKSLSLRCVLFPLYPRLTHSETAQIVKVLGTLP